MEILLPAIFDCIESSETPVPKKILMFRLLCELHVNGLTEEEDYIVEYLENFYVLRFK